MTFPTPHAGSDEVAQRVAEHFDDASQHLEAGELDGYATQDALDAHVDDTTAAHAASAISVLDAAGVFVASNVEAALLELLNKIPNLTGSQILSLLLPVDGAGSGLDADKLDGSEASAFVSSTDLTNHITDAIDAHDASAISVVDTGAHYAGTEVEAVLAEIKVLINALGTPGGGASVPTIGYSTIVSGSITSNVTASEVAWPNTNHYLYANLTDVDQAFFAVTVGATVPTSPTTAVMKIQYTTDLTGATGWAYLDSPGANTGQPLDVKTAGVKTSSAFFNIPTAAKGPILLRLTSIYTGADTSAISLQVREAMVLGKPRAATAPDISAAAVGNLTTGTVATQLAELDNEKQALSQKSQASGYASLNASTRVPVAELGSGAVGDGSKVLADNGSWVLPSGSGDITAAIAKSRSVRVASTANIQLSTAGFKTIDTVVTVQGDRVLAKNQTIQANNGLYVVSATGTLDRATDADSIAKLRGLMVFAEEGSAAQANTLWYVSNEPAVLGTDAVNFAQFQGGTTATYMSKSYRWSGVLANDSTPDFQAAIGVDGLLVSMNLHCDTVPASVVTSHFKKMNSHTHPFTEATIKDTNQIASSANPPEAAIDLTTLSTALRTVAKSDRWRFPIIANGGGVSNFTVTVTMLVTGA